jgi:hypothetical protein
MRRAAPGGLVDAVVQGAFKTENGNQPFATAHTIIDTAIDTLANHFAHYKSASAQREKSLRRRLRAAEASLERSGAPLEAGVETGDIVWFRLNRIEPTCITGWAILAAQPEEHLQIEVFAGDERVAGATADRPRPDLSRLGYGDGGFGFRCDIGPVPGIDRTGLRVVARWDNGEMELGRLAPVVMTKES